MSISVNEISSVDNHAGLLPASLLLKDVIIPETIIVIIIVDWKLPRSFTNICLISSNDSRWNIIDCRVFKGVEISHALGCHWFNFVVFDTHLRVDVLAHVIKSALLV